MGQQAQRHQVAAQAPGPGEMQPGDPHLLCAGDIRLRVVNEHGPGRVDVVALQQDAVQGRVGLGEVLGP